MSLDKETLARIAERVAVYKESPSAGATWGDVAKVLEFLLMLAEEEKKIGFTQTPHEDTPTEEKTRIVYFAGIKVRVPEGMTDEQAIEKLIQNGRPA